MSCAPVDIIEAGVAVRYKIYSRRDRKPFITYCIGFDINNPLPERDWKKKSSDQGESFVRAAVQSQLAAAALAAGVDRGTAGEHAGANFPPSRPPHAAIY